MSLEVFLFQCKDVAALEAFEAIQEATYDQFYDSCGRATSVDAREEYRRLCHEWDAQNPAPVEEIRVAFPSAKYFSFDLGCFVSLYNEYGLNTVLKRTIGRDLYDIFEPPGTQYRFTPDWQKARNTAQEMLEQYRAFKAANGDLAIATLYLKSSDPAPSPEAAMTRFLESKNEGGPTRSSSVRGDLFGSDGINVLAIIPGVDEAYAIYGQKENKHYEQALENVIDTCDYVLGQPNPNEYILHWSA